MKQFKKLSEFLLNDRGFNAKYYIDNKVIKINEFFEVNKLDSCVIGISGGIDSAVVYKLLKLASEQEGSPIKIIKPLLLPINSPGITGQSEAISFGEKVIEVFDGSSTMYLSSIAQSYSNFFPDATPWTQGQIASIVRTPILYGQASYLQQKGYKSIVVGTTNRDEGAYIGFYGKASDAMVDLQPIADIHKLEVIAIAKLLSVPKEIIERVPTGDVYDGSTDEETIGAPYWFIQLYLLNKQYLSKNQIDPFFYEFRIMFTDEENSLWGKYSKNIEELHRINAHKYEVGVPSHFIDLMDRKIFKGWK